MNSKRLYFGLLGLIGLLCVSLLAGVYGANSLLTARANSLTSLKAKSQALTLEQQSLTKAKKDIRQYSSLEQITKVVVPEDKSQAEAVREIVNIAAANGVTIGSITFPLSSLGDNVGSAANAGAGVAPTTPAPSPAASNAKAKLSQLLAVKGIPGVYQLTITVVSDPKSPVLYNQVISFLNGLEHDRRTAQVNSLILQPVADDHTHLTFTITLNEYIKP
jgi:hypothetical protein